MTDEGRAAIDGTAMAQDINEIARQPP